MKNQLPKCYNYVDEKLDVALDRNNDRMLKRHVHHLAISGSTPIIHSIYGDMINQSCYIFDSYSKNHEIVKK